MRKVHLYEKPIYYSELADRDISKEEIKEKYIEIINVCTYKVQQYVNRHYGNSFLDEEFLRDMVQETSYAIVGHIQKYTEEKKEVPFWAYIGTSIRSEAAKAYRDGLSAMGESGSVSLTASKVLEQMRAENMTEDEAAEKLHMKKTTIQSYVRIGTKSLSMDEVDEEGHAFAEKVGLHQKSMLGNTTEAEALRNATGDLHEVLTEMLGDMNEDAKFIVGSYIDIMLKEDEDWRIRLIEIGKEKNISEDRTMDIVYRFRKRAKNKLKKWAKNGKIGIE